MKNAKVTVGREWEDRTIYVMVSSDEAGIEAAMTLPDFLSALVASVGNPTLVVTQAGLERRILEAAEKLITQMKRETVAVA